MSQYRQWLHYRHIDQQLQTQKDQLTVSIEHLQERVDALNAPLLDADNFIVQALSVHIKACSTASEETSLEQTNENGHIQQPETISQALFEHSRLPDLESLHSQNIHDSLLPKRPANTYAPLPPVLHKAIDLIPEDTNISSDEHGQTEPQVALPWWLRNAALSATQNNMLDSQSIRTNHLVQRWLERWDRQEEQKSESVQTNGQQLDSQQEDNKQ